MNARFFVNPFFLYILIFLSVLLLYSLEWSYLQPSLSIDLTIFFISTFVFGLIFFVLYNNIKENYKINGLSSDRIIWLILIFGALVEFAYQGAIPFLEIMRGRDFKYNLFGVPVFHVFFLPYISAVGILSFYKFLILRKKSRLYIFLFSLLFVVLIFNRGAILFILISAFFVYLKLKKNISIRKMVITFFATLFLLYLFGAMGNYRMLASGYKSDDVILTIGQATPNFYNSKVPSEFLWSYLYIVTPYANLQFQTNNVSSNADKFDVFKNQILIDFIQKRVYVDEKFNNNLIVDEFNVSTMYGKSVQLSGLFGAYISFFWFVCNVFFITVITPKNYRVVVSAIFSTMAILTCFTNVIVFAGFILQPIFVAIFVRFKFGNFNLI